MSDSILQNGYPCPEELAEFGCLPGEERCKQGPVAVIECIQPIPCNPCEEACRFGAIRVGQPITNLPVLDEGKCTGCGLCIAHCSGLAIFVVDKSYKEGLATVSFPHEYLPLPTKGQQVNAVDRGGKPVCRAEVVRVMDTQANDHTPVVTVAVPLELADVVRGMQRLGFEDFEDREERPGEEERRAVSAADPDDTLVCRCEEVTVGDIRRAVENGARTLTGIKRRTRAGMGLCQGRSCQKLVTRILSEMTGQRADEIGPDTERPPMLPVKMDLLGGGDDE